MKFKIRFADQISGIFVLFSLVFLAAILVLMGLNQRWFIKDPSFTSKFDSAKDLSIGMDLDFKGFKIGSIDDISLNSDNTVSIYFHIFREYIDKVTKHSVIELSSSPIGLGSGLLFYSGKSIEKIVILEDQPTFIPAIDSAKGEKLVTNGLVNLPEGSDTINKLIEQVGTLLTNVDDAVISLNSVLKNVGGTFDGSTTGPVADILTNVDHLILDINGIIADIAGKTNAVLSLAKGIASNLEETTNAMTDPTGLVTRLLDPQGSIARLLNDDNVLYDKIDGILEGIDETITQLNEFASYINSTSPQITGLLEEGQSALDEGKDVLEGIKNNPLISGGIAEEKEQQTTFESFRDEDF